MALLPFLITYDFLYLIQKLIIMEILTLQEYFFSGVLGLIILIVFFVMASNLRKIRNNTEENKEILTKILELKEQELGLAEKLTGALDFKFLV